MLLALRSLFFTIVVPGTVAVLIPYLIVSRGDGFSVGHWAPLHFVGLVLMVVGAAILARCIWDFAAKGRGRLAPIDPPKQLVVQHTVAWFIVVNLFVVLYEEPSLRSRFGDSYERYFRSVHRWFPTSAPRD